MNLAAGFLTIAPGSTRALAIATSVGMFIYTRNMIPEAIYTLAFEGIFYLFLRSWTGSLDTRIGYWGAAALCAVAVLTRAMIGLVFPGAAIVAFITMSRGWRRWRELAPVFQLGCFSGAGRAVAHSGGDAHAGICLGLLHQRAHQSRARAGACRTITARCRCGPGGARTWCGYSRGASFSRWRCANCPFRRAAGARIPTWLRKRG